jgi:deoxyribonuclease-4
MQKIILGPAGTGGDSLKGIQTIHDKGLNAVEIEFTYGVRMSNELAKKCGETAKRLNMHLSVHAPYYVNLASLDKKKIEASKKRILESCERGNWLGAEHIVFHPGFYGKYSKEECYQIIKKAIAEMQNEIRKRKWKVKLAPETTGKASQFGDLDELLRLKRETGCDLCIDFAHMKARTGKRDYREIFEKLEKSGIKSIHAHFSGIEYTAKGERRHILTPEKEIPELLMWIKKSKIDAVIINESPDPLGDSLKSQRILEHL